MEEKGSKCIHSSVNPTETQPRSPFSQTGTKSSHNRDFANKRFSVFYLSRRVLVIAISYDSVYNFGVTCIEAISNAFYVDVFFLCAFVFRCVADEYHYGGRR